MSIYQSNYFLSKSNDTANVFTGGISGAVTRPQGSAAGTWRDAQQSPYGSQDNARQGPITEYLVTMAVQDICVYRHVCARVYSCARIRICVSITCVCVYTCARIRICVYNRCACVCVYIHVHEYVYAFIIGVRVFACIFMCTNTYMRIY